MKQGMELNGVANLKLILDVEITKMVDGNKTYLEMDTKTYEYIETQVELLERYMLAYNQAVNDGKPTPHWHEVRENPKLYPLHREIVR